VATEYRIIRTRIAQMMKEPFLLAISSPGIGDGKTVTAVNLAVALAMKGAGGILLVDGDLRRANIHSRLGIEGPGLAEVLAGKCRLDDAIVRVEQFASLYVLPAGEAGADPAELFDSSAWRDLATRLRGLFSNVIVDCPPVDIVADYDLIAPVCDRTILVVRPDHTDRSAFLDIVARVRPHLVGLVVNSCKRWLFSKSPVRDYRYYYDSRDEKRPRNTSG
jgi:capsular exopolysaccharide synthesis family protein